MANVAPWKKKEVAELVELLKSTPVVGLAQVDGIPSAQMQEMRKNLRVSAKVRVSKNTLLTLALKEAGANVEGMESLVGNIGGSTAILASEANPFQLFRQIEGAKTKAPARGGDIAPEDIKVTKGETPFKPGPVVGDLQQAGIPARIEGGKVMISADKVLVKQGDAIPDNVAKMLTRLEIFPMTVGMDLKAVYQDGMVFGRDTLSIDFVSDLMKGAATARALGIGIAWTTKDTIEPLIGKASAEMLALARKLSDDALTPELKEKLEASAAAAAAAPAVAAEEEAPAEEEEEEEGASEEDAAAGLGALFG